MILERSRMILGRRLVRSCVLSLPLIAAASAITFAAEGGTTGRASSSEVVFLCEITLLLALGRLLGEVMLRIGQPAVMGQLIAGILLGPSALGALWAGLQHA